MTDDAFWGNWRSYCHELNEYSGKPDELAAALMDAQINKPFMPPEPLKEEAWQYAAELWQTDILPQELELLAQIGRMCVIIGHDSTVDALDSGDWSYYYTDCGESNFDDVTPEQAKVSLGYLAKSYWEDGPYSEITSGLIKTLQEKFNMNYVPPEETLYAIFSVPMLEGNNTSYEALNFSGIEFGCGSQRWSPGWDDNARAQDLGLD